MTNETYQQNSRLYVVQCERGGVLLEYFALISFLVVACIIALPRFGVVVSTKYEYLNSHVEECIPGAFEQGAISSCIDDDALGE